MGVKSDIRTLTPTFYLDFTVQPGAQFSQPIKDGWTTFAYTLDGTLKFGKKPLTKHDINVLPTKLKIVTAIFCGQSYKEHYDRKLRH